MQVHLCPGYIPHPQQLKLHRSRARFLSLSAGTRGGKTKGAAAEFAKRIFEDLHAGKAQPVHGRGKDRRAALHYWVVAPTAQLLKEPKRYLMEMIPAALFEDQLRPINSENQAWLKGDILIEFRSADNPFSLVSVGLNGMWLDESARIKAEAWKGNLSGRLTDRKGWCLFSSTPLGHNWFYEEIVKPGRNDDPRLFEFHDVSWTTAENTTIDPAEIESAKLRLPWRYFQREYLASYDAFLGNVYDEFSEATHVITEAQLRYDYGWGMRPLRELFRRVVAGVDWGWTSPGAIVVVGDTGRERIVVDEEYEANRSIFDPRDTDLANPYTWVGQARRLRAKWGISQFLADPAEPSNIFDFQRSSLPVTGAFNEVTYGVRRVSEQLHPVDGKPKLRILSNCKNLIREKRSYVWDQARGSESMKEVPAPNQSDHALDAERYAVVELVRYESPSGGSGQQSGQQRRGPVG